MAVATIPTLGAVALPPPTEQMYTRIQRGGTLIMASGKIVHDLVDNTPRHRFRLRWSYLTNTELGVVQTAWDAIKASTATYVSVRSTSHTVTRPEGGELEVVPVVTAGGDLKFHVAMELQEDS